MGIACALETMSTLRLSPRHLRRYSSSASEWTDRHGDDDQLGRPGGDSNDRRPGAGEADGGAKTEGGTDCCTGIPVRGLNYAFRWRLPRAASRKMGRHGVKPRHLYISLIVGLVTPWAVVGALEMLGQRRVPWGPPPSIRTGDIFLTAIALIPFAALIPATKLISLKLTGWRLECVFWCGLLAVTAFTAYGHVMVWWPLYFGGRMSSTAVIAFLFIPFYALGALIAGLIVGYVISLLGLLPAGRK